MYSSSISADTKLEILHQAVGTCPQVSLQFGEKFLPALLDSGSEVTLVRESFFHKYIEPIVASPSGDKANAHNLFKLSGMEQGQLPVSRYFKLDVELLGFKVAKVGFLVIKDPNTVLSPDKPTSLPCVIGSNLIQLGLEEFVKQYSISAIQLLYNRYVQLYWYWYSK